MEIYSYEIDQTTFAVTIKDSQGNAIIKQPVNPETGQPFANLTEAENFAIEQIYNLYSVSNLDELKAIKVKQLEEEFAKIVNKYVPVDYAVSDITQMLHSLISLKGMTTNSLDTIISNAYKDANDIINGVKTLNDVVANITDQTEAMLVSILTEKVIKSIWYMNALITLESKKAIVNNATNPNEVIAVTITESDISPPAV